MIDFGQLVRQVRPVALRQAIIPNAMLGRALGIVRTLGWGLTPIATVLGGFVARIDLRLPFVIGGGLVVILTLVASRLILSASVQTPAHEPVPEGQPS